MTNTKNKWWRRIDPNLVIAVGVLLASFAALFVYVRQANIMSEQTRILMEQTKANAWPHLSLELYRGYSSDGMSSFKITVSNKGTGPAILEQTQVAFDGQEAESWQEFFEIINIPDSLPVVYSNSNISERVLASNESLVLIDWSNKRDYNNTPLMEFIYEQADKISVEICYSSIHGDLWKVKRVGFKSDLERHQRFEQTSCDAEAKIFRE